MVYIYGLRSSDSALIMYVGKSVDPAGRLINHLTEAALDGSKKQQWIYSVLQRGAQLEMMIIDVVDCIDHDESWREVERFWIAYFFTLNPQLTNGPSGVEDLLPMKLDRADFILRDRDPITVDMANTVKAYTSISDKPMRISAKKIEIESQQFRFPGSYEPLSRIGIGWHKIPGFLKAKVLTLAKRLDRVKSFSEAMDVFSKGFGIDEAATIRLCIMDEYRQLRTAITKYVKDDDLKNWELIFKEAYFD